MMRFEGSLKVWNAERGHGVVASQQGGQELFVHISAFPADGPPPSVDEALSFEVVSDGDGRKQAVRVQRSRRGAAATAEQRVLSAAAPRRPWRELRRERRRRIGYAIAGLTLVVLVLGWLELSQPGGSRLAERSTATAQR